MPEHINSGSLQMLFSSYHTPSEEKFEYAWQQATFVLDANVLLNLYRYSSHTSDQLLNTFELLKNRLWMPHHAALEFERNRLIVISEQKSMFKKVRDIVLKNISGLKSELNALQLQKRHSSIDTTLLVQTINETCEAFQEDLAALESTQIDVNHHDAIYSRLDVLLNGRIGPPFEHQEAVDGILKEYDRRLKYRIPPGYNDAEKMDKDDAHFSFRGVLYNRKAGDLILWEQIKSYVLDHDVNNVIFITDDRKDDWWYIVDSSGKKTMGPRPELVEEIVGNATERFFWMYTPERFAEYARTHLNLTIDKKVVQEIKRVSFEHRGKRSRPDQMHAVTEAVLNWVIQTKGDLLPTNVEKKADEFEPDAVYLDRSDGKLVAAEVMRLLTPRSLNSLHPISLRKLRQFLQISKSYEKALLIIVTTDLDIASEIEDQIKWLILRMKGFLQITIGIVRVDTETAGEFMPLIEMS